MVLPSLTPDQLRYLALWEIKVIAWCRAGTTVVWGSAQGAIIWTGQPPGPAYVGGIGLDLPHFPIGKFCGIYRSFSHKIPDREI